MAALAEAFKEGIWLSRLLLELGQKLDSAFLVDCDNRGAVALAANPGHHKRTKHIDVRYHAVREAVDAEKLLVQSNNTGYKLAGILTKVLKGPLHAHHVAVAAAMRIRIIELGDVSQVRAEGIAAARGSVE